MRAPVSVTNCYTVFSALRVFALWNHSYRIAAVVLVLGLAPVFFNAVRLCVSRYKRMRSSFWAVGVGTK